MIRRVYIAGPYTAADPHDVDDNVYRAMEAASKLIKAGLFPYCPHLLHFVHTHFPQPYETWIEQGLEWVEQCDAVLRLPGESNGADMEEDAAREATIPVFYRVEDLLARVGEEASRGS